jgi:hypothetical protein
MRRTTATIFACAALGLLSAAGAARGHTDKPTQTAQQNALKKLDEIIARLEEEEKGRGDSFGKRPARDSTIRKGPGGMGTLHAEKREGKQWGELPPKERERILQSMNDGFPSHYQTILERYFARLADEKPLADADKSPPDAGAAPAAGTAPDVGAAAEGAARATPAAAPAADAPAAGPATGEKEAK